MAVALFDYVTAVEILGADWLPEWKYGRHLDPEPVSTIVDGHLYCRVRRVNDANTQNAKQDAVYIFPYLNGNLSCETISTASFPELLWILVRHVLALVPDWRFGSH